MDELLNDAKLEIPEDDEQPTVALKGKIIKFTWLEKNRILKLFRVFRPISLLLITLIKC